jgi:hypothetical protein
MLRPERVDPTLSEKQRQRIAQLEAIGYLAGSTTASEHRGVVAHRAGRAYRGLNFYTSGHAPEALLMDMDGNVLHRWRYAFLDVWPDYPRQWLKADAGFWRRAHLYENGDLLAIFEGMGIIKLDKDSNLLWANPIQAHHDLQVMPGGAIYVLTRKARLVPRLDPENPVLEDFISILDAQGDEKKRVSLLESFERSEFRDLWDFRRKGARGDLFHANTVAVLDGRLADEIPAFQRGNVLTSLLVPSMLAVVDLEQEKIVWLRMGGFKKQHDPKVLANGNLLLFDNRGAAPNSRVLELDPAEPGRLAWEFKGSKERPFFSHGCGAAERLPKGNTLITESDAGRAFEVTPEQEIVWEFYNPYRLDEHPELVPTLFEMVRLPPDFPSHWAHGPEAMAEPAVAEP